MIKNRDFDEQLYAHLAYPKVEAKDKALKKELLQDRVKQLKLGNKTTVADLVENMAGMSIQARNIGLCGRVLKNIYDDPDRPTIYLGLAGPLIAAGLRSVIRDLIVSNAVDVVVATGGIIYQDIYAAFGHGHFKGTPDADDAVLTDLNVDRIYDTYIDDELVMRTDRFCKLVADEMAPGNYSSRAYLETLAERIDDEDSILFQCHKLNVPVFVPALNDSSIGIGLTEHQVRRREAGKKFISIDAIQDNYELVQTVVKSPKTAAFYVAGGVPKNYINDSIVMSYIYGFDRGHDYAIQVTTAVPQDGGLSSSTLSEGRSWGKIKKDARYATAWVEPSVSLPLLAGYVLGRKLTVRRSRLKFEWENSDLKCLKTI